MNYHLSNSQPRQNVSIIKALREHIPPPRHGTISKWKNPDIFCNSHENNTSLAEVIVTTIIVIYYLCLCFRVLHVPHQTVVLVPAVPILHQSPYNVETACLVAVVI